MKMPPELIDALAYHSGHRIGELRLTEFLEVMDEYAKIQEETRDFKSLVLGTNSGSNPTPPTPRTTMLGVGNPSKPKPAPRKLWPCIFCDAPAGSHSWHNCQSVTDPAERYRRFNGRCTACGSTYHHWTQCPSQKSCQIQDSKQVVCGEKHHISLHQFFKNKKAGQYNKVPKQKHGGSSQNHSEPPNGSKQGHTLASQSTAGGETQGTAISGIGVATTACAAENNKEKVLILGILQGHASHPLKPEKVAQANIYLDEGSDTSYITRKMVCALGLPITGKRNIEVNAFGGHAVSKEYEVANVRLSSRHGEQAIIEVLVTEEIVKPLQTEEWKQAEEAFPTWSFPQLAQSPFHVDILIGIDHLTDIRKDEIQVAGALEARQTILGPYIIGRLSKHNEETTTLMAINNTNKVCPKENYRSSSKAQPVEASWTAEAAEAAAEKFLEILIGQNPAFHEDQLENNPLRNGMKKALRTILKRFEEQERLHENTNAMQESNIPETTAASHGSKAGKNNDTQNLPKTMERDEKGPTAIPTTLANSNSGTELGAGTSSGNPGGYLDGFGSILKCDLQVLIPTMEKIQETKSFFLVPLHMDVGDHIVIKKQDVNGTIWAHAEVIKIGPMKVKVERNQSINQATELHQHQNDTPKREKAETEQVDANSPNVAPEPTPRSRPQRAAKTAGREKVQNWTKDLLDD